MTLFKYKKYSTITSRLGSIIFEKRKTLLIREKSYKLYYTNCPNIEELNLIKTINTLNTYRQNIYSIALHIIKITEDFIYENLIFGPMKRMKNDKCVFKLNASISSAISIIYNNICEMRIFDYLEKLYISLSRLYLSIMINSDEELLDSENMIILKNVEIDIQILKKEIYKLTD